MTMTGVGRAAAVSVLATLPFGLLGAAGLVLSTSSVEAAPRPAAAPPRAVLAATSTAPVVELLARPRLPSGKRRVFPSHTLVAYYGTAGSGALGVLGEADPDAITKRLRKAAKPFATEKRPVQLVYELIVTIADATPGPDGDFNHDIAKDKVQAFIEAAHRNNALLILDLQPGRSDFLTVAKRWEWALQDPWVGLALDPEWRMGPGQVPAQVIGSVGVSEVNAVSKWLNQLSKATDLPEKVLMLHSFRTSMIRRIGAIKQRSELALVEHVDGFGTPGQKLSTYHAVARPKTFHMGFKLFYDEDVDRMNAKQVLRIRPTVEFVSFQ